MSELPLADELRPDRCETCRYFDISSGLGGDGKYVPIPGMVEGTMIGSCRRFPPSLPFESAAEDDVNAVCPTVYQSDWCGEWQAKGATRSPVPVEGKTIVKRGM